MYAFIFAFGGLCFAAVILVCGAYYTKRLEETTDMTTRFLFIIKKSLLADASDAEAWQEATEKELAALHPNFFQRVNLMNVQKKFFAELSAKSKDELEALLEQWKKEVEEQD